MYNKIKGRAFMVRLRILLMILSVYSMCMNYNSLKIMCLLILIKNNCKKTLEDVEYLLFLQQINVPLFCTFPVSFLF